MKGYETTYAGTFGAHSDGMPTVERIEVPLIQRDYAQGRENTDVRVIRDEFLGVLVAAITGGEPVGLDFVYGRIADGTFEPLDGQQRLTTLFLLHWYLASRAGVFDGLPAWTRFGYATRRSAARFSEDLARNPLPPDAASPSEWITDQPWYLFAQRHDPTVQSMLVMLDAIHARLAAEQVDSPAAWARLTDPERPAISFLLLPLDDIGTADDLYIKMNSRGKPLTPFENFKARFENALEGTDRHDELVGKIDNEWSDILWQYRGEDDVVDDEFLRYIEFVVAICEWRDDTEPERGERIERRAEAVFGPNHPNAERNLDFLFHAFDTWTDVDVAAEFAALFASSTPTTHHLPVGAVALFESSNPNLFEACCQLYGERRRGTPPFTLNETLLLFAVLIHRQYDTEDFARRLRIVRNITEGAGDEVRLAFMPELLAGVEQIIRTGSLENLRRFNHERVQDEQGKRRFLSEHPELEPVVFALEDHPLLRGRLFAFELDAATLPRRAATFQRVADRSHWPELTGALLAEGDYFRERDDHRARLFGSATSDTAWRELFTRGPRREQSNLRDALGRLLDDVAAHGGDVAAALRNIQQRFLDLREAGPRLDWRYHFVKYPTMRSGSAGVYFGQHLGRGDFGYSICMPRGQDMRSFHRDVFLFTVWETSGVGDAVQRLWFEGYESYERWMRLARSRVGIRCVGAGFAVEPPQEASDHAAFARVCDAHGVRDGMLSVPQLDHEGQAVDTVDRVQLGAAFLRDLVDAGL